MQIQILRRSCDNPRCDRKIDLPVGGLTPMMEAELSNWVVMTKEHVLHTGEQPQALSKMGCCASCAVEIVKNNLLDMPKPKLVDKIPAAN